MESYLPGNPGNPPTMKPSLLRIGVRLAIILVMTAGSGVAQAADDIEIFFKWAERLITKAISNKRISC
jgi:hypothetical protein